MIRGWRVALGAAQLMLLLGGTESMAVTRGRGVARRGPARIRPQPSTREDYFEVLRDTEDDQELAETARQSQGGSAVSQGPAPVRGSRMDRLAQGFQDFLPRTGEGITNLAVMTTLLTLAGSKVAFLLGHGVNPIVAYQHAAQINPLAVKACTSGIAYGTGDTLSQLLARKTADELDLGRSARSATAGFLGHGPFCHYWICWMETHLNVGNEVASTLLKVFADQTVWSLYLNAMYATIIGTLAGKSWAEVDADVKETAWPALQSSWRFWPFVHIISFGPFLPVELKLLFIDTMEIAWVCILSRVNNEGKEIQRTVEEEVTPDMLN